MTLLTSTNKVLLKLREGEVTAIDGTEQVQGIVDGLNDAAHRVLKTREWEFLKRYDGFSFFPATFIATTGGGFTFNAVPAAINLLGVNSWTFLDATRFTISLRSKVRVTNDSGGFANTSFIVANFETTANFPATLSSPYRGATTGTGAFEIYAHEFVLPTTVRKVLSVSDQEGDIDLKFVDRDTDFDKIMIRPSERKEHRPLVAYVGGIYTTTTLDGGAATTGTGMMIWPPPNRDVLCQYTYIHDHPALVASSDTWENVPDEVVSLIESEAFEAALIENRQADPQRAVRLERSNARRMAALEAADDKQPRRRMAMQPVDRLNHSGGYWTRWDTQEVPEP